MSRLLMRKTGNAKYLSHLDLMRTMQRAFVRAGLEIKHTQGFNPHPYMSFALPLSVGIESLCELMDFELDDATELERIPCTLNQKLPAGLHIVSAYRSENKFKNIKWLDIFCELYYDDEVPENAVTRLQNIFSKSVVVEKRTKRGTAQIDIFPLIGSLRINRTAEKVVAIDARISAQDPSLNPGLLITAINKYEQSLTPDFTKMERREIYDADLKVFR